jgi:hypothetical protein
MHSGICKPNRMTTDGNIIMELCVSLFGHPCYRQLHSFEFLKDLFRFLSLGIYQQCSQFHFCFEVGNGISSHKGSTRTPRSSYVCSTEI